MRRTAEEAAQTRAALSAAALHVFARRGFAATTLAEVSEAAGLTRGAIYHHFTNKTDLYVTCVSDRWAAIMTDVWADLGSTADPSGRIRGLVRAFCRALQRAESRELLALTMGSRELLPGMDLKHQAMRGLYDQLIAVCTEAEQAGQLRSGLSARLAAEIVLSGMSGLVSVWGLGLDDVLVLPDHPDAVSAAIVRGLFYDDDAAEQPAGR